VARASGRHRSRRAAPGHGRASGHARDARQGGARRGGRHRAQVRTRRIGRLRERRARPGGARASPRRAGIGSAPARRAGERVIVAVVSDVHSNLEALEAVLADAEKQGASKLWCLGGVVGYGADPNAVCERLKADAHAAVAGNHDWAACGKMTLGYFNSAAAAAAEWTAEQLSPSSKEWLASLPLEQVEDGVRLVHGSP